MQDQNLLFLRTNRHHLESVERDGTIKGLQSDRMREVMVLEFRPNYPGVDSYNAEQVAQLVKDIYFEFDQWTKANCY